MSTLLPIRNCNILARMKGLENIVLTFIVFTILLLSSFSFNSFFTKLLQKFDVYKFSL